MNVSGIYDLYKADTDSSKKVSDSAGRISEKGMVNIAGTVFDNEFLIKNTRSTSDAYDRIKDGDEEGNLFGDKGDRALTPKMLEQLGNVVNENNFDMYEELGIAPDKDEPASILTVSERIEIELAAHCDNYKPSGNISLKDIEAMYGNTGRTYQIAGELLSRGIEPDKSTVQSMEAALDKIDDIKSMGISSDAAEYLLANNKPVTVDNVYTAIHSVTGKSNSSGGAWNLYGAASAGNMTDNSGIPAKESSVSVYEKISDADWQGLLSQAKAAIENTGLEVNEGTLADARFLVETKIPITEGNLYKLSQIRDINHNQCGNPDIDENAWISKLSSDLAFLGNAGAASMDYYSTVEGTSIEAVEILNNGTEEQVTSLVLDGRDVTLLNMKRVQDERSRDNAEERREQEYKDLDLESQKKVIAAKRTLEEARLRLTVGSGAFLIKNGFNINIMPLSDTVEKLKQLEDSIAAEVFRTVGYEAASADIALYHETTLYMREFAVTPAYVLGEVYSQRAEYSVISMTEAGRSETMARALASEAYDVLGTKPDRALGDSINKAFHDIPDMLEKMGLENNSMNNRAVRILAYNELEINEDSIGAIREMDTEVSRLIDNLTPKTTAYLIANGMNPLNTNISELNDTLDEINSQIGRDEVEKYSEYLFQLDRNKSISREDREAYIGIYRVLHMIEKSDRRAIGALAKQGGELTMSNMLALTRSLKRSSMDISVDDELGIAQSVELGENNIDSQLSLLGSSTFFKRVKDSISPELLASAIESGDKSLSKDDLENDTVRQNHKGNVLDYPLDEFFKYMSDKTFDSEVAEEYDASYHSLVSEEIENIRYVSEEVIRNILQDEVNANMGNMLGVSYIMNSGRKLYDNILAVTDDDRVRSDIDEISDFMSVETDRTEAGDTSAASAASDRGGLTGMENEAELENIINKMSNHVREALLSKASIRIEDIRGVNGAVNYIRQVSEKHSYYVPVEYGGEKTLLKLTLRNDEETRGRLDVRIFGNEQISEISATIKADLEGEGINITIKDIVGISRELTEEIAGDIQDIVNRAGRYSDRKEPDNNMLLGIAKEFIGRVLK